jgi:ABC-type Na+ transport system ATPase subunit NatA
MTEVECLCDKIAIIHKGTIIAHGSTEEILEETSENTIENAYLSLIYGRSKSNYANSVK